MNHEPRVTRHESRDTNNEAPHELSGLSTLGHVTRHLHSHPDLVEVLKRVFDSDAFMITFSWVEVADPKRPAENLQHHFKMESFARADVIRSLVHLIQFCKESGYGIDEALLSAEKGS